MAIKERKEKDMQELPEYNYLKSRQFKVNNSNGRAALLWWE